jgi:hypothetical protein
VLRLIVLLCFNSVLSAAVVAVLVTSSVELVAHIEQALENPRRSGAAAAICAKAIKVGMAFLICGALTWRLARHIPL